MSEKLYWFVAAVFRDIDDLAATLVKLRAHDAVVGGFLILAARLDDIPRKLSRAGTGDVPVAVLDHVSDCWQCVTNLDGGLDGGLRELLDAAQAASVAEGYGRASPARDGMRQVRIYTQLRQDADDGANILVASVPSPGAQLSVARALLRQNCERVLTHEIAGHAC